MDLSTTALIAIPTVLVSGGAAWGAAKQALNGTRERVQKLEEKTDHHADTLARVETKVDILIDRG